MVHNQVARNKLISGPSTFTVHPILFHVHPPRAVNMEWKSTVCDTENLTFPQNSVVVPRGQPRIAARTDADNPRIDRGESAYRPRRIRVVAGDDPRG